MSAKSDATNYGTVALAIHWVSAILIVVLVGSGFRATGMEDTAAKVGILQLHIPLGVVILFLTLGRVGWWWFADKKPASISMASWQDRASKTVHFLFYVVIFGMAGSAIGMMVLSGAGPIIFGAETTVMPDFWDYLPRTPHGIGARVILALFVLHVGAALYHHFIKKDGLIGRMWLAK